MKKAIAIILSFMLVLLCACSDKNVSQTGENATDEALPPVETLPAEATTADSLGVEQPEDARVFTVYFSHNDPVEAAAQLISEKTGCETYKIETYVQYPENEEARLKQIREEHLENARPALKGAPMSLSEYDIIFLCFPAWDGTMPMAFFTFIEDYDMRDKAVIPVVYGTQQQLEQATVDIHKLVSSMLIVNGYQFTSDISALQGEFSSWIDGVLYG